MKRNFNISQRKVGVILQYGQMGLSTLISLFYTPVMLRILGQGEYGIYNLASSIISYLSLLSLGLGASYVRFYSRYKVHQDDNGIKILNGTYFLTFCFIAIIAFFAGLVLAFHVDNFFTVGYTDRDLQIAKILMIFMSFNLAWSFPISVFYSYITSQEKFIFQKIIGLGRTVISPMMTLPVLLMGYGSIGMVVVTTIITCFFDSISIFYCLNHLKMKFSFRNAKFSLLKEIGSFSIIIAINQIVDQINWNVDKVILAKIVGKESVAIYAVGSTINTMYINFASSVSSVFIPQIHKIVALDQKDRDSQLTEVFIKVGRIQFAILALILTGFLFFGKYFISFWAGSGYEISYYIVLLLIGPVTISLIQNIGIEIQRAKDKHYFRMYIYLAMALINIFLSIFLCSKFGVIGTTIGTTISLLIANGLIMNIYYYKKLGINVIEFWKQILKMCLGLLPVFLFGTIIMNYVKFDSKIIYFGWILLYTGVYALSMWCLSLNKYEKNLLCTPLKNIYKRIVRYD